MGNYNEGAGTTRVELYAELRNKIDRMDTLSFDDPDRDRKYGLNNKKPTMPIIHEESMSGARLQEQHIKKNTLSMSIEDLIKQNDDYTLSISKKEINKDYKSAKRRNLTPQQKKKRLIILIAVIGGALLLLLIILLCVLL